MHDPDNVHAGSSLWKHHGHHTQCCISCAYYHNTRWKSIADSLPPDGLLPLNPFDMPLCQKKIAWPLVSDAEHYTIADKGCKRQRQEAKHIAEQAAPQASIQHLTQDGAGALQCFCDENTSVRSWGETCHQTNRITSVILCINMPLALCSTSWVKNVALNVKLFRLCIYLYIYPGMGKHDHPSPRLRFSPTTMM